MFENKGRLLGTPVGVVYLLVLSLLAAARMQAQTDPGVRGGAAGAGETLPGLTVKESKFFDAGKDEFQEVENVVNGLGPRFNSDSCVSCHSQPAIGGTSPFVNPQVAVATKDGATNAVPFFISINGPVREARFKFANPPTNTIHDGGVHGLYTITGRTDASGCNIAQPDFNTAASQNNLIFRIPTPVFGAGLIEGILDFTILANKASNLAAKAALGISGHENREGNAGTITRIGWKAQNKSLAIFSGEAYNVEMGITNELFQNERDETPGCRFNAIPEDQTRYEETQPQKVSSGVMRFEHFMRLLAQPTPACGVAPLPACSGSINNGRSLFTSNAVGCALCHTPLLQTAANSVAALSNKTANLFSDLLVHHMGSGLADDIIQGSAGPDEFRSSPLWGLGQRIFFLHDGRTSDLLQAILAHSSSGSEANGSIAAFNALTTQQKQDILNFLRSL
jgi:CxxC motif-containing protein (DUF1111 family)